MHAIGLNALGSLQQQPGAQTAAHRHGRREAHAVEPIVHAHAGAFDGDALVEERGNQRQREKAVRDGRAKGPGLGTLRVHMDPLVVARGVGKQVDLLLRDGDPVGHGHFLAHASADFGVRAEGFHRPNVAPRRGAGLSGT